MGEGDGGPVTLRVVYRPPIITMSWSITIEDLNNYPGFKREDIEYMLTQHPEYPADMELALVLARKARLSSAVLTGGRTPNPYGTDEVVDISIRGMARSISFVDAMRRNILAGPDDAALDQQNNAEPV